MAIVKAGPFIETIRGSVGCVEWKVRRTTGRVGRQSVPRARSSPVADETRRRFTEAVRGWGSLESDERAAWNTWADAYGQAADPEAVPTSAGQARYTGSHSFRAVTGQAPLAEPVLPGIGNAFPAFIRFTPTPGTDQISLSMLEVYATPPVPPAFVAVYIGRPQGLSRMGFRSAFRLLTSFELGKVQPGIGGPPLVVSSPFTYPKGTGFWALTRVGTDAGNTSSRVSWSVRLPEPGMLTAFSVLPAFDSFRRQQVERRDDGFLVFSDVTGTDSYEFPIDLTASGTDTIGEVFAFINAIGLWQAFDLDGSSSARPATDIPVFPPVILTTRSQPRFINITEP